MKRLNSVECTSLEFVMTVMMGLAFRPISPRAHFVSVDITGRENNCFHISGGHCCSVIRLRKLQHKSTFISILRSTTWIYSATTMAGLLRTEFLWPSTLYVSPFHVPVTGFLTPWSLLPQILVALGTTSIRERTPT